MSKASKLSYICNEDQVAKKAIVETEQYGVFIFIQKKDEQYYFAYRKVDMGRGKFYYAQTTLPKAVFESHIKTGLVNKLFS